jgi:putative oxidoreductase
MIMTVVTQEPLALARRGLTLFADLEQRAVALLRRVGVPLLRISLGVVFVWFGALKIANVTPVGDLVAGTLPFVDPVWFVPFLGGVEVALGLGLLLGRAITVISAVLVGHLCGTFLVLVMQPELAFQNGNPLLLTTIGEFVVKNVVLIAAALVLAARLHHGTPRPRAS